jgi:hypothetical protein
MALRQEPSMRSVPVVLVTSSYVDPADRALARRAGANDLVARTPELAELLDSLRSTLTSHQDAPPWQGFVIAFDPATLRQLEPAFCTTPGGEMGGIWQAGNGPAVDTQGNRLGRGGGAYDRALTRMRPGAFAVALVYADDVVDAVPVDSWDIPVAIAATPRGISVRRR